MKKFVYLIVIFTVLANFNISRVNAEEINQTNLKDRPNIIIISIDSLRADHVGCYGYYRNTTPNIDAFGKDAVLFKYAFSNGPSTIRSISAFCSSKYNSKHFIVKFPGQNMDIAILNPHYPTLPQLLKKEGYTTYFISDVSSIFYIKGFKKGFDAFTEIKGNASGGLTKTSLEWIGKNKKAPFFVWLHYYGPHHPYLPNKASEITVPLKEKDKILSFAKYAEEEFGVLPYYLREEGKSNLNYYINNYDGKILLTDEYIGSVLNEIKKLGFYNNSLIVITADHGEEFGEHNKYCGHGWSVYNALLHVPLLIKMPNQKFAGKVINENVSLLDVVPTILHILNVKKLDFDGETLLSIINNSEKRRSKFIYSSSGYFLTAIIYNEWKLIRYNQVSPLRNIILNLFGNKSLSGYRLYNLKNDPYEQKDLSGNNIKIFIKLRDALLTLEEEIDNERINKMLPVFREEANSDDNKDWNKEKEKLINLGYLN